MDTALIEAQLAEARSARHALIVGSKTVSVEYDGRKVQYTMMSIAGLDAYIRRLEQQLASVTGIGRRRALRVTF